MTSADDLLARIDAVLAEQPPPTSECGIEGHDCSMLYVCRLAALLRAESMGVSPDSLCLPTVFDYPPPPYEIYDDGEIDPDDAALDFLPDADGFGWADAMSWSPPRDLDFETTGAGATGAAPHGIGGLRSP